MNNLQDLHAQVLQIKIGVLADLTIKYNLSTNTVTTSGSFFSFNPQSTEFSEKQTDGGGYIAQEFKAITTSSDEEDSDTIKNLADKDVEVEITYTNNVTKVIGSSLNPVRLTIESSGNPKIFTISFKRNSFNYAMLKTN